MKIAGRRAAIKWLCYLNFQQSLNMRCFQTCSLLQPPTIFSNASWDGSLHNPNYIILQWSPLQLPRRKRNDGFIPKHFLKTVSSLRCFFVFCCFYSWSMQNLLQLFIGDTFFTFLTGFLLGPFRWTDPTHFVWTAADYCPYWITVFRETHPGCWDPWTRPMFTETVEKLFFSTKQSRAEFSWLLVRGNRTKGFLCCLRRSQPTTVEYSPAESESETSQRQSKLRDKLCADSGLILPRCYGLLSVLDQTNYAAIYLRLV